jgi:hypothetical protein
MVDYDDRTSVGGSQRPSPHRRHPSPIEEAMSHDMQPKTDSAVDTDERALVLRDQGRPFAGVAGILGLDSAGAAHASFNRALRRRPRAEQERLRVREMERLDALASRLRGRDDLSMEEIVRRLRGVKHQRRVLLFAG